MNDTIDEKTKFAQICDYVFIFISTFILVRLILKQSLNLNYKTSLTICIIFAFAILFIAIKINTKKLANLKIKKQDKENFEQTKNFFETTSLKNLQDFFIEILNKNHQTKRHKNYIELENNEIIVLSFATEVVTKNEVLSVLKEINLQNFNKIHIFCFKFDNLVLHFAENTNIEIRFYNIEQVYNYLKKQNKLPKTTQAKTIKQKPNKLAFIINREKTSKYFYAGISLYFLSFFIKAYNTYYIVFASILLLLSICCLLFTSKKFKPPNKINL